MGRSRELWATDPSLFHRIRDAVWEMARGKGSYGDRANYAAERIQALRPADFPDEHQETFSRLVQLVDKGVWYGPFGPLRRMNMLSPRERQEFAEGLLGIYEDLVAARAKIDSKPLA